MDVLGDLELFLHNTELPTLIHIALCHYQFEAVHPFLDGNGRIGRLLITLLLVERKMLPSPLLYLSAFFDATREEYYSQLYNVSSKGTWQEWLIYFLNGVALQSEDALSRTERINELLNTWELNFSSDNSKIMGDIIRHLTVNPYLTVKRTAEQFEVAYSTAQRCIKKLESAGVVQQAGDGKRDKVYCAKTILDILEEPTKIIMSRAPRP